MGSGQSGAISGLIVLRAGSILARNARTVGITADRRNVWGKQRIYTAPRPDYTDGARCCIAAFSIHAKKDMKRRERLTEVGGGHNDRIDWWYVTFRGPARRLRLLMLLLWTQDYLSKIFKRARKIGRAR